MQKKITFSYLGLLALSCREQHANLCRSAALGSSPGQNSFRMGSKDPAVRSMHGLCTDVNSTACLLPEEKLQAAGGAAFIDITEATSWFLIR